jgi:hypothetical protein
VAEPCPQCNAPFQLEKTTKKGTTRTCAREDCDYKEEVPQTGVQPPASGTRRGAERVAR